MSIAEIRDLRKTYPAFRLQDASFSIEAGKITGFIGRNGAGKTTTIKSVLNLVHPDRGEIRFFGRPLSENEAEIKKRIGYSTGTVQWYPRKRIGDIAGIVSRFYETWDDGAYERYRKLFQLDPARKPIQLSEGMKVKFNLLLALSHHAEILILDEPTTGLDPFSRDELLEVFRGLRDEGVAVFFSTHIITDLEKCADDVVYISRGKIVADLPKEMFRSRFGRVGESLEDTILRMEKEAEHA